jgi:hypothetical protein
MIGRDWNAEVEKVLAIYSDDPEKAHVDEDELLESYVRERASENDLRAISLLALLDWPRTKWYA